ncbi:MAG: quinolinate synthase NadA, partial [Planctomycetota bacterium]
TMADMAEDDDVEAALAALPEMTDARIVPITYVNSSAATKAITARYGGACCTSSNVRRVFAWALTGEADGGAGAEKILSIPDQHLARNTAVAMGYSLEDCVVYDPARPGGGLTAEQVDRAKFLLWKGHCYVHQFFLPEQIDKLRREVPGIQIIVHPESRHDVVAKADAAGSTEQIIRAIEAAEPGSKWAIGTESNLVERLARRRSDCEIRVLSDIPARCQQMSLIDLPHLLWVLDGLAEGEVPNRITVPEEDAADARIALERMLAIPASAPGT